MFKWVQSGISAVTGIAEPEYGRQAIHPVTDGLEGKKVYNTLLREDLQWSNPDQTNVETQTFYFNCFESGYIGFAQVIHSDMVGLYSTAQQTFKIFHKDTPDDFIWTSTKLENFKIDGTNFYADGLQIELSEDGKSYTFLSDACLDSIIELTIERIVDGVKFGENGATIYGENKDEPWGSMRHVFWPRNKATGTITLNIKDKKEDNKEQNDDNDDDNNNNNNNDDDDEIKTIVRKINGTSMYVMLLQGMKPHHAAAAWNFLSFTSKKHSVVAMEFITPKSYATTKVSIGIITDDTKIISCCINNDIEHIDAENDEVGWPVPHKLKCGMTGYLSSDDLVEKLAQDPNSVPEVTLIVTGNLDKVIERVDVMAEIPGFIKNIVSGVVGTKPYIYQFCNDMKLDLSGVGEGLDVVQEDGIGFSEASFISYI